MSRSPGWLMRCAATCALFLGAAAGAAEPQPDPSAEPAAVAEPTRPLFETPMVCDIRIDGLDDDWQRRGQIGATLAAGPMIELADDDLSATLRAGWDERGLLVLIRVTDDIADEAPNKAELHEMDALDLFVGNASTEGESIRCTVAPGRIDAEPEPRTRVWDRRRDPELRRTPVRIDLACRNLDDGYLVEALIPWEALGIEPRAGLEIGFDLTIHDADGTHRRDHLQIHPLDRLDDELAPRCRLRLTPMRHELALPHAPAPRDA